MTTVDPGCAIVHAPVAPVFAEPRVASPQISQLVAGRCVELLEQRDDWYRIRGPDEYEGWLHRGYLSASPDERARQSTRLDRVSLGCITTNGTGRRAMPLGSLLAAEESVKSGDVVSVDEQATRFPAEAEAITRSARLYFEGTSYLWGGVTPWGADCSGLVQTSFWLHGIQLRRDAWQQSEQGEPGEADLLAARTGDLLFFSDRIDGHITHVAIALGMQRLVHLALGRGGYAVERLADERDPYVAKLRERFVKARRVLPAD
ncbi:MAG: C40 family peptidase [Gemmatimonadaceae bacterium]|nr:C40 family peptidase [Gemmatimonadaceae bacterium]NUS31485.1 C40 family peptidase [Gemmatimonadaceae bacterium]